MKWKSKEEVLKEEFQITAIQCYFKDESEIKKVMKLYMENLEMY